MSEWSATPIIDWVLYEGRFSAGPEALVGGMCDRLAALGMPLDRVAVFIQTLHPQYFGFVVFWEAGSTRIIYGSHSQLGTSEFRDSPMRRVMEGERVIRRPLYQADCPMDYPVLQDLRDEGFSDYVLAELVFSNGVRNGVSLSTRNPDGFSEHDIGEVQRLLHLFALAVENYTNRGIAANLLDTYLGAISGSRVLEGKIQRGDGEQIDAVIWFSDLRDSTRLAESLGHERFLELLNDYFEATAGAVLEHGGEVLRFIGDASLAVFPIGDEQEVAAVCARAVCAARSAVARADVANLARAGAGRTTFAFGIGLHRGEVIYGNIGTPERLEFSVIGPAANETARIEALTKTVGSNVVVSETVVSHLDAAHDDVGRSLGRQQLRGVGRKIEVFALAS